MLFLRTSTQINVTRLWSNLDLCTNGFCSYRLYTFDAASRVVDTDSILKKYQELRGEADGTGDEAGVAVLGFALGDAGSPLQYT